jgi:ferredoxin--NADP+ reductase
MRLVRNELVGGAGDLKCRATSVTEEIPVDLVFRSVGYRGIAIPGLPFNERRGVVPNESGRVRDEAATPVRGMYVSGWIKRGPSGVIGTNKKDGTETATAMLEDAKAGAVLAPAAGGSEIDALVRERQPSLVTYADWSRLDQIESARGAEQGRPRVKICTREEVRAALS